MRGARMVRVRLVLPRRAAGPLNSEKLATSMASFFFVGILVILDECDGVFPQEKGARIERRLFH